ncbi:MAG: aminopeptidase P family protein [Bacteroidetes bacterium]|nr:aminopeptidase P family protein [Bacteroidota bacterium]
MRRLLFLIFAALAIFPNPAEVCAQRFEKTEYAARRDKLMAQHSDGLIIIMGAAARTDYYRFFQNNNFMYLTGVAVPDAYLVIDPVRRESVLFATLTEYIVRDCGEPVELAADPTGYTGITMVKKPSEMEDFLKERQKTFKKFYTCFQPEELPRECSNEKLRTLNRTMVNNIWDGRMTREMQFVANLVNRFPGVGVEDCSNTIHELRIIKSPAEIELLREAGKIGVKAHLELMRSTRPGVTERELAALFEYTCRRLGAQDLAYNTIICTDINHTNVHYHIYDRTLADGDFLVVDAGPDLGYYDIDITITFPANGKFTPRQKEIYEASLAIHEAGLKVFRPGIDRAQAEKEIAEMLTAKGFDMNSSLMKALRAGFGHYVGMAVHDVGGSPKVLRPGMVIANEPYTYFADEKLGVRVENTILITETGCENLTPGLPRTVAEIEKFMKNR